MENFCPNSWTLVQSGNGRGDFGVVIISFLQWFSPIKQRFELDRTTIDIFDGVMVMSDDEAVKINRLTLLNQIRNSFLAIADISVLQ